MGNSPRLVRFDWAAKRLLRNKSNFVILEGFLTTLLGEKIRIERILESEGNQDRFEDKFNRVDMLAENSKGELIIIEVQNSSEVDYFHRMLYGTCKAIAEYINQGDPYDQVHKVYSVNIVYFDLGQGEDYVYHGYTVFRGLHNDDVLQLSVAQQQKFIRREAGELFPEYYVLRVNDFDRHAVTPLDEWILFLKTGEIDEHVNAEGLLEARNRLRIDDLDEEERKAYLRHQENVRYQKSLLETKLIEGKLEGKLEGRAEGRAEGLAEGRAEGELETKRTIARNMKTTGVDITVISQCTGLSVDEIEKLT